MRRTTHEAAKIMPMFLTFQIGSKSEGRFAVTGPFDFDFGFMMYDSERLGETSYFAAEGVCLKKLEDGKVEFSVSVKKLSSAHRFNLRFADDDDTNYGSDIKWRIHVEDLRVVDKTI
jgi:hypothetical protein